SRGAGARRGGGGHASPDPRNLRRNRGTFDQGCGREPQCVRRRGGRALRADKNRMTYDPKPAAIALRDVRRARGLVLPLPASIAPRTEAEGAAAQLALAQLVGAVPCTGFKIGATGKRMQEYLGL